MGSWSAALLYFFPGLMTYKQFVTIVAVFSAACLVFQLIRRKGTVPRSFLMAVVVLTALLLAYMVTPLLYGTSNETHTSYFLVLVAQVAPAVMCAIFVAQDDKVQERMKRLAPIISLFFTFIAYQAIFHPTGTTATGYIANENGLSYQSATYLVAYAAGLMQYYLVSFDEVRWYRPFRNRFVKVLMFLLVLADFFMALIAGGRGAVVLFGIVSLISVFLWTKKKNTGRGGMITAMAVVVILTAAAVYIIHLAATSSIATSGFGRILNTIETGESSGRDWVYDSAWAAIAERPFFGHGLGSVYFEMGYYAHNFFLDAMVETGIVGCIFWVVILAKVIRNLVLMVKKDRTDYIWAVIFLDGFMMSMFSGYYLIIVPIAWVMAFLVQYRKRQEYE